MRSCCVNLPNRCYRVAHRAFFLDDEERTRVVDFIRRISRFSGVKLLAYSVMSNHFHVFVYIGYPEELDDAEAALHDVLQWTPRPSRHDVGDALQLEHSRELSDVCRLS